MRAGIRAPVQAVLLLGVALLLGALTFANYRFSTQAPGGNDFLARWVGARAWVVDGRSPYDPQVSLESQQRIYGRPADPAQGEDVAHFVYPLPSMIFFAPFGLLPYPLARALWMTLLEVGLLLLPILSLRIHRWQPSPAMLAVLLLFSLLWYHGVRSVIVGQFAVIEAVLMIGALFAIQRREDSLAGILLGLSIAKPQMPFLLIPFVLLWGISRRRWALVLTTLISIAALMTGSLVLMPDWPIQWMRQLLEYPSYTALGSPIAILVDYLPRGGEFLTAVLTLLLLIYLIWEWILALRKDDRWFQWTAAMTLVITNLIALRTATTNFVVLIEALILIFAVWTIRWPQGGRLSVYLVLLAFGVGLWVLFLRTVSGNIESPLMYFPLPFLTFFGLLWVRWWAIAPRPIQLEM